MKHVLTIDFAKCTGCRNCELACSIHHFNTFNPARSRIRILKDDIKNIVVPMVCLQCENPLCKEACPSEAIQENEKGILFVSSELCIGCMNCINACVYGGIAFDSVTNKAIKCDHCEGDPACLKACEYGAIEYVLDNGIGQRYKGTSIVTSTFELQKEEA